MEFLAHIATKHTYVHLLLLKFGWLWSFREIEYSELELDTNSTLNSLISKQQILFFLRKFFHLHALLEPTHWFIFGENSHLHDH